MEFNLFKPKKYRDCKKIAKRINKQLSTKYIEEVLESSDDMVMATYTISQMMEYFILSNDKKTDYLVGEIDEKRKEIYDSFDIESYRKNRIYASAGNGYYKSGIEKKGFTSLYCDKELFDKIAYCEKFFGDKSFYHFQNRTGEEKQYFYFSLPGSLVTEYAVKFAPERLYLGMLSQDYPDVLPYKVGEGRANYFNRLIDYKVSKNNIEDENAILYAREIIEKLCTKKPIISLFQKPGLKATTGYLGNGEKRNLLEDTYYVANDFEEGLTSLIEGAPGTSDVGDLVTDDFDIKTSDIGIIEVPDYYSLIDIKAKQLGFKEGEEIDILTQKKPPLSKENLKELHIGNTGRLFQVKIYENEYLFKPAESRYDENEKLKYRAFVQEAAYKVQKIVDPHSSVFCQYVENDELGPGTIQEKIDVNETFSNYKQLQREGHIFNKEETSQLMREYVTDYLLCNFDAHGGNFIVSTNCNGKNTIHGIDKEQSFKYLNTNNFLDINENPNMKYGEQEMVYNTIFKQYIDGKNDFDFPTMTDKYIKRVEETDDKEYRKLFENYASSMEKSTGANKEELLDKIVKRKQELRFNLTHHFNFLKEQKITKQSESINPAYLNTLSMVPNLKIEESKGKSR